jgi:CspA family cold shock protein
MTPAISASVGSVRRGVDSALQKETADMPQGTVKWFSDAKGFGFLEEDGGGDVFVHHSEIQADGFRTLSEGDRVEFETASGPKGPKASSVRKI